MEDLADIIRQQHERRAPHDDPLVDALLRELLRVAEEVCVLRDRLETCQSLARAGQAVDGGSIDAFEPDATSIERRLARHKQYYEDLFARLNEAKPAEQQ